MPHENLLEGSALTRYQRWLRETQGLTFEDYSALWNWSTEHLEDFWTSIWDFFDIHAPPPIGRSSSKEKCLAPNGFPAQD